MLGGLLASTPSVSAGHDFVAVSDDDGKSDGLGKTGDKIEKSVGKKVAGAASSGPSPSLSAGGGVPPSIGKPPAVPVKVRPSSSVVAEPGSADTQSCGDFAALPFKPQWNLLNGSRLAEHDAALEFIRHAFPAGTEPDMVGFSNDHLVELLRFAAAQSAFFLAAAAKRVESQAAADVRRAALVASEREARRQVSRLEKDARQFDDKLKSLGNEKMIVEERLVESEGKMEKLLETNEGLNIQIESLERDVVDRDRVLAKKSLEVDSLKKDLGWLLKYGVVSVVDKVIDCPEFINGIVRIKQASFAAGEESGRHRVLEEIVVGGQDVGASSSNVNTVADVEQAIEEFATLDFAALLNLEDVSLVQLKDMCKPYEEMRRAEAGAIVEDGADQDPGGQDVDGDVGVDASVKEDVGSSAVGGDSGVDVTGGDLGTL